MLLQHKNLSTPRLTQTEGAVGSNPWAGARAPWPTDLRKNQILSWTWNRWRRRALAEARPMTTLLCRPPSSVKKGSSEL